MSGMTDFFQKEALECRRLADRATEKEDREYWLRLAQRWERLLQPDSFEADQKPRFERLIFTKKRFAKRRAA
jgi:hypothetical protein